MEMKVFQQNLRPGMKNGNKAELAFKLPSGVFRELLKSLINGAEEDIEADLFVDQDQGVELVVNGEDGMEVFCREQFAFAVQ